MRGKISREKLTFRPRDIKNGGFLVVEVVSMRLHFARICILQGLHFVKQNAQHAWGVVSMQSIEG